MINFYLCRVEAYKGEGLRYEWRVLARATSVNELVELVEQRYVTMGYVSVRVLDVTGTIEVDDVL
jgi:hypothetical protein